MSKHDLTYTIVEYTDDNDEVKPRLQYALFENARDWQVFTDYVNGYSDVTNEEEINFYNHNSYTLKLICDWGNEETLKATASESACCLQDKSELLGGGYCVKARV